MKKRLYHVARAVKGRTKQVSQHQKVRFGLVGVVNTAVDFIVLNVLVAVAGVPVIPSNIVSTTAAMITSFSLNKSVVFKGSEGSTKRQLIRFFIVTFSAIWIVQSTVIFAVFQLLESTTMLNEAVILNCAKLAGISAGLIWNYIGYSRFVFNKSEKRK